MMVILLVYHAGMKSPGLESSWLKSLGLKGLGLKLGVEKSGVEISFNPPDNCSVWKIQQVFCLIFCAHVNSNKGLWRPSEVDEMNIHSQDNKNHWFLTRMSLNHEKLLVWNVSIWVRWPCRTDLCQLVIITFQYDIRMRFDLVRAIMFSGGKIFLSLLIKPAALRNQISIHCNSWNWPELKFCWSGNKMQ